MKSSSTARNRKRDYLLEHNSSPQGCEERANHDAIKKPEFNLVKLDPEFPHILAKVKNAKAGKKYRKPPEIIHDNLIFYLLNLSLSLQKGHGWFWPNLGHSRLQIKTKQTKAEAQKLITLKAVLLMAADKCRIGDPGINHPNRVCSPQNKRLRTTQYSNEQTVNEFYCN